MLRLLVRRGPKCSHRIFSPSHGTARWRDQWWSDSDFVRTPNDHAADKCLQTLAGPAGMFANITQVNKYSFNSIIFYTMKGKFNLDARVTKLQLLPIILQWFLRQVCFNYKRLALACKFSSYLQNMDLSQIKCVRFCFFKSTIAKPHTIC